MGPTRQATFVVDKELYAVWTGLALMLVHLKNDRRILIEEKQLMNAKIIQENIFIDQPTKKNGKQEAGEVNKR